MGSTSEGIVLSAVGAMILIVSVAWHVARYRNECALVRACADRHPRSNPELWQRPGIFEGAMQGFLCFYAVGISMVSFGAFRFLDLL